jgi:alcohol dehydrogenase (NADP+)
LIHWPVVLLKGHDMPPKSDQIVPLNKCPIEATWTAMEKAVDDGLVRSIGVSNFSVLKLSDLLFKARIPPAVNQVECHPYLQQKKLKQFCDEHNIHVTAYSPLGADQTTLLDNVIVKSIASKLSVTPGQVLLAWALAHHHSAVCKSSSPARLQENLDSMNIKLSMADLEQMKVLDCGHRFISGEIFCLDGSPYSLEHLWDETIAGAEQS